MSGKSRKHSGKPRAPKERKGRKKQRPTIEDLVAELQQIRHKYALQKRGATRGRKRRVPLLFELSYLLSLPTSGAESESGPASARGRMRMPSTS